MTTLSVKCRECVRSYDFYDTERDESIYIYYMYSIGQGKRLSPAEKLDYSHVRESLYRWLLELHKIIWSVWKGRFPVSTWRA